MMNLLGGLIFSTIGLVMLGQGKRNSNATKMVIGAVMIVYPYFVSNAVWMFGIGGALAAALIIFRE